MLYYIFRFLEGYGIAGSRLWSYVSFRALLALIVALIISLWFGEHYIRWMKRHNLSEEQRDFSIDPYGVAKKGVPSMGGIVILVAVFVPCLLFGRLRNIYILLMLAATVWFAGIGFLDDYIKNFRHNKDGLAGRWKLVGQFIAGLAVGLTLYFSPDAVIRENVSTMQRDGVVEVVHKSEPVKSTKTTIPFFKNNNLDYAEVVGFLGDHKQAGGWILFVLMTAFVIAAVSNGANLNDGMDGMCAGNSAIIYVALGVLAYVSSHIGLAGYLNIMFVPESEELVVYCCAMLGALIGFLWYNTYPARVFMGDTGSLMIGGTIGVLAVIIHKELLIPILCGIFLMESISVILQTEYAKAGNRRGKKWRVFKRAPLHDTFRVKPEEMLPDAKYLFRKWPKTPALESMVTVRFWIISILLAVLTIITLKIR
ncbi:MAG: phospho-N-acetylmuramoyl-pentapeptide-transferase [Bacteroidaceae bacterium]|nr:phospho-N-acetylmuramoyl-pentapeptide-transferase [Bacteroidaceae bacterium]